MLRELKKIPRKDMADKLKMTEEGLARIERDEVDVNMSKLGQIAEILEMEPSQILDWDGKMVFHNHGTANDNSFSQNNFYAQEAIKAHIEEIAILKEEVAFLRGLVKEGGKGNGQV